MAHGRRHRAHPHRPGATARSRRGGARAQRRLAGGPGIKGRVDRWPRTPHEQAARADLAGAGRAAPCPFCRRLSGAIPVVRLLPAQRPRDTRRARPAAQRLLPVERRLRVHHPAAEAGHGLLRARQRSGAQDQGVRLKRRRPGPTVLLRSAQQMLGAAPLGRQFHAGGIRRTAAQDPAPMGADHHALARPKTDVLLPWARPAGRPRHEPTEQRRAAGGQSGGRRGHQNR